jgi:hypothetical protein
MDYSSGAGSAAAGGFAIMYLACMGIFALVGLALLILNIWMLIDAIQRQEYEFPNSTGSSKNLWVILLAVGLVLGLGWIVGLIYFFMVFKKIKRGTMAPPQAAPQYTQPAPQGYVPPAPPAYAPPAPPAPPMYAPPAPPAPPVTEPPAPPAYEPPPAPPAPPVEMPAPPAEMPAPPAEPPAE